MNELIHFDQYIFQIINGDWHFNFLDQILPYWREKTSWIPFYLFLCFFLVFKFKEKGAILIMACLLTVGVADTCSSHVIKTNVKRVRPCNDLQFKSKVKLRISCGSGYSFTSSHATNHFALATFLILCLAKRYRWIKYPLYVWAGSIAYSQVYVGVHYPIDVICGALLGYLIARLVFFFYQKYFQSYLIPF